MVCYHYYTRHNNNTLKMVGNAVCKYRNVEMRGLFVWIFLSQSLLYNYHIFFCWNICSIYVGLDNVETGYTIPRLYIIVWYGVSYPFSVYSYPAKNNFVVPPWLYIGMCHCLPKNPTVHYNRIICFIDSTADCSIIH